MTTSKSKASIDVDIGGTFTDCYLVWNGASAISKAPTTGYNLSIGFMNALRDAASSLDASVGTVLSDCEIIRYSTTIAMNTLIQRTGPRLGLVVTEGFEDIIPIGKGSSWADSRSVKESRNIARIEKPEPLIPRAMTVAAKERVDVLGRVIRPLDEEDFLDKLQYLVDKGVRGIVVCLLWSFLNPIHEQRIKKIIKDEYPDCFLGAIPVILSSEICPKRLEYTRSTTTILNAYLHESMWDQLCGMGDELRDFGYKRAIMMVHNNGGMAEVFRTSAIQTFNGGPVAGLIGAAYLGKILGFKNVVVTDAGGTTFDLGTVVDGSTRFYEFKPTIDRWLVDLTMLETRSIGAGGGSIARLNKLVGSRLEVGPQSAGSMPGPVAYNLGGTEPTVTDADIVLGYINPEYYHGGDMKLDAEMARESIDEKIAKPLGMSAVEAAALIKRIVDANMGDAIAKETFLRGYDPKDFVLFATGGAGPTHCCGYASHAGINKVVVFPFSSVYCAFGSSTMDTLHIYEQSTRIPLLTPNSMIPFSDYEEFNSLVAVLKKKATKDLTGDGYPSDSIVFELELDMQYGGQLNTLRILSPLLEMHSEKDVRKIYEEFEREYSEFYSPYAVYPQGGVEIHNLVIKGRVPIAKPVLPSYPEEGEKPSGKAFKGHRQVYWGEYRDFHETSIYEARFLGHGNMIEGPAIIESENTTIVLEPGWNVSLDQYKNLILTKNRS